MALPKHRMTLARALLDRPVSVRIRFTISGYASTPLPALATEGTDWIWMVNSHAENTRRERTGFTRNPSSRSASRQVYFVEMLQVSFRGRPSPRAQMTNFAANLCI
jgi:hypothetical protein